MREIPMSKRNCAYIAAVYMIMMCGCDDVNKNEHVERDLNNNLSNDTFLTCHLQTRIDSQEGVILEVTFVNHSHAPMRIEKRLLLLNKELDGARFFYVRHNSAIVPYHGLLIKRNTPGPDDYYEVLPTKPVTVSIRLKEFFNITRPGRYTISYEMFFIDPKTDMAMEVKSNTVDFDR